MSRKVRPRERQGLAQGHIARQLAEPGILTPDQVSLFGPKLPAKSWRGVEEVTRVWLERDLITDFEKLPFYLENLDTFTKLSDKPGEN